VARHNGASSPPWLAGHTTRARQLFNTMANGPKWDFASVASAPKSKPWADLTQLAQCEILLEHSQWSRTDCSNFRWIRSEPLPAAPKHKTIP
jgi:hypothetical protein